MFYSSQQDFVQDFQDQHPTDPNSFEAHFGQTPNNSSSYVPCTSLVQNNGLYYVGNDAYVPQYNCNLNASSFQLSQSLYPNASFETGNCLWNQINQTFSYNGNNQQVELVFDLNQQQCKCYEPEKQSQLSQPIDSIARTQTYFQLQPQYQYPQFENNQIEIEEPIRDYSKTKSINRRTYDTCFLMNRLSQNGYFFERRDSAKKSQVSDRLLINQVFKEETLIFNWDNVLKKCNEKWEKDKLGSQKTKHDDHCSNFLMNLLIDKLNEIKNCNVVTRKSSRTCAMTEYQRRTIISITVDGKKYSAAEVERIGKEIYDKIKTSTDTIIKFD